LIIRVTGGNLLAILRSEGSFFQNKQATPGRGMLTAIQARTDRTLRIRMSQVGPRSLP